MSEEKDLAGELTFLDENYDLSLDFGPLEEESYPEESHGLEMVEGFINRDPNTKSLLKWRDPLTPPQFKNRCVDWVIIGGFKTCRGWRQYTRWMDNHAVLYVKVKDGRDVRSDINDCLKTAAVVAAIVAIKTGGKAAVKAAEKALYACLSLKLGSELVDVDIRIHSKWSKWARV